MTEGRLHQEAASSVGFKGFARKLYRLSFEQRPKTLPKPPKSETRCGKRLIGTGQRGVDVESVILATESELWPMPGTSFNGIGLEQPTGRCRRRK